MYVLSKMVVSSVARHPCSTHIRAIFLFRGCDSLINKFISHFFIYSKLGMCDIYFSLWTELSIIQLIIFCKYYLQELEEICTGFSPIFYHQVIGSIMGDKNIQQKFHFFCRIARFHYGKKYKANINQVLNPVLINW